MSVLEYYSILPYVRCLHSIFEVTPLPTTRGFTRKTFGVSIDCSELESTKEIVRQFTHLSIPIVGRQHASEYRPGGVYLRVWDSCEARVTYFYAEISSWKDLGTSWDGDRHCSGIKRRPERLTSTSHWSFVPLLSRYSASLVRGLDGLWEIPKWHQDQGYAAANGGEGGVWVLFQRLLCREVQDRWVLGRKGITLW